MYIIKLKCLILADWFPQYFGLDNLNVHMAGVEPVRNVVEEKQSSGRKVEGSGANTQAVWRWDPKTHQWEMQAGCCIKRIFEG